jgi:hypothetical protein
MFGGNSNWRGPVWFPMNTLLIRALFQFHAYYGDAFPRGMSHGLGPADDALEVATSISSRLQRIFLREPSSHEAAPGVRWRREVPDRPALARLHSVLRVLPRRQRRRLGASHQTGWTALVAGLAQLHVTVDAVTVFESSRRGIAARMSPIDGVGRV